MEYLRIQKIRIDLAGFCPTADVLRIARNGELLPDLKTHLKVFRDLIQILAELVRCWWAIGSSVIANRAKAGLTVVQVLAILAEALACKRRLGVRLEVDLALPAFVGPGGRAGADERREGHRAGFYPNRAWGVSAP